MEPARLQRHERTAIRLLMLAGVTIPLYQLLFNRSLWSDESAIAMNIITRDFVGLLKPLDIFQMAPILYLWVVKAFSIAVPNSEIGLRLPSFLAYLATLYLLHLFLRRHMKSGLGVAIGIALFVFSRIFLVYSSELKQYMTEAFVTMTFVHVMFSSEWSENRIFIFCTVLGSIGIGLSHTVVMVLPMVMSAFILARWGRWDKAFWLKAVAMGLSWVLFFASYYFTFLYKHPSLETQYDLYWVHAFPPPPGQFKQFIAFFLDFFRVCTSEFGFTRKNVDFVKSGWDWFHVAIVISICGLWMWTTARRHPRLLALLIPAFLYTLLVVLHLYPAVSRLFLFASPILVIVLAMGTEDIVTRVPIGKTLKAAIVYSGILLLGVSFIRKNVPREAEEARTALEGIGRLQRPGDGVYVYQHGRSMFDYYLKTGNFKPSGEVTYSLTKRDATWRDFYSELPIEKGPFWIFFAHMVSGHDRLIVDSLVSKGFAPTDSVLCTGASAYRIDPRKH